MSGSICNGPTDSQCIGCPDDGQCREPSIALNSCCSNFDNIKKLAIAIVNSFDELPTEKFYTLVHFASDAQLVIGLAFTGTTISNIEQLVYTGGMDNHAGAISACERSFDTSWYAADTRRNAILLITDGLSDTFPTNGEHEANIVAAAAKGEGTVIVPVLVPPDAPDDTAGIDFVTGLSSDGVLADLRDYDVSKILQLRERVVSLLSCQN